VIEKNCITRSEPIVSILPAALRWRLRLVLGSITCSVRSSQTARASGLGETVAATGKICTELAAARWRLRFVVGVSQLLRAIFSDCQSLRPRRDSRRYRKDQHRIGSSPMATALCGWGQSVASCNFLRLPEPAAWVRQSPLPERSAPNWKHYDGDCVLWLGSVSCFVQFSQTARAGGLGETVAATGKICTELEAARWRLRFLVGVD
jgi:hypothetical protein